MLEMKWLRDERSAMELELLDVGLEDVEGVQSQLDNLVGVLAESDLVQPGTHLLLGSGRDLLRGFLLVLGVVTGTLLASGALEWELVEWIGLLGCILARRYEKQNSKYQKLIRKKTWF